MPLITSACTAFMISTTVRLPARSALSAWITATSGRSAGTAASASPVKGQATRLMFGFTLGRSIRYSRGRSRSRSIPTPPWPNAYEAGAAGLPCASGAGQPFSTASRTRWSEPTPGLPVHENTSLSAQPMPTSWS